MSVRAGRLRSDVLMSGTGPEPPRQIPRRSHSKTLDALPSLSDAQWMCSVPSLVGTFALVKHDPVVIEAAHMPQSAWAQEAITDWCHFGP